MLNTQQQAVVDLIQLLAMDETPQHIVLEGEGGTGKTYSLTVAIESVVEMGGKVLVCAPTHMARQGLMNKLSPETIASGRVESRTTASLLGRFGFRTGEGNVAFSGGKIPATVGFDLVVIDECSMLSQNDLNKLVLSPVSIVFTGDQKQLPTVKQKRADWSEFQTVTLTEQVRQHGAILQLAQKNRDGIYIPTPEDMAPEEGLHMVNTDKELVDQMISDIMSGTHEVYCHRYLTYTNDEVYAVNDLVHRTLFKELGNDPYLVGQYLLLEQTCEAGYNSEIVQVTDLLGIDTDNAYGVTTHVLEVEGRSILRVVSPDDRRKLEAEVKRIKELIKIAREHKNTDALKSLMREIEYIEEAWIQVNYIYATTVHKGQGMSIPKVYLNLDALNKASNKRALLYVGISRASEELWMNRVELSKDKVVRRVNVDYRAARAVYTEYFGYDSKEHWRFRVNNATDVVNEKTGKVTKRHLPCSNLEEKQEITHGMLLTVALVQGAIQLASMKMVDSVPQYIRTVCANISED